MSESVNNQEKPSFGATVAQYAAFPAVMTGVPAVLCTVRHRGAKKALEAKDVKAFKDLNIKLKQNGTDWFTRNTILNESYQSINSNIKESQKLANKIAKAQKGKIPITKRIKCFFKGEDITSASYKEMLENSKSSFDNAIETGKNAMKSGKSSIAHEGKKELGKFKTFANKIANKIGKGNIFKEKVFDEALENSAKGTLKRVIKNEMFSKFDIFMSLVSASKEIKKVPSAFKDNGFIGGIKQIGKAAASFGVDLVGYGAGGFVGKTVGSVIGNVIAPGVGGAVGGTIGNMLGSMVIGGKIESTVDKALGMDENESKSEDKETSAETVNNYPQQAQTSNTLKIDRVA